MKQFGFDFDHSFPDVPSFDLPKGSDCDFPPMYKSGVLITSLHEKGFVLQNFLLQLDWTPKRMVLIDDQMSNIRSVYDTFKDKIPTIGIHYTAASDPSSDLDENAAKYQVDHFLKSEEWISQEMAIQSISSSN